MFKSKSIRFKLFALVIAILIPLVILRAINIFADHQKRVQDNLRHYENLASAISTAFTNYLEEIWIIEDIAGTYIKEHPDLSTTEIYQYLALVKQKQEGLTRITWLDPEGKVITSSDARLVDISLSNRSYVRQIRSGQEKVASELIESVISPHASIIPVARGIYNKGKLSGIIVAIIDLNKLEKKLPDFNIDRNDRYLLIDNKGMLVYRSDMKKTPDEMISFAQNAGVKNALNGKLTTSFKEKSGLDRTYAMSVDYPISEIGWVCKVSTSYEATMAYYYGQIVLSILVLVVSACISIVIAVFIGHRLLKPISILRIAAKKIMEGDYSARTNYKGDDEIGLAAEAFDKMAESIEQWYTVKSHFFTNMSHELKTPLNVIFSSVQLIDNYKASMDPEMYKVKVTRQMTLIRQNCYRITRIISNLIDISRHDSGFLKIRPDNYDIVKLIKDITLSVKRYVEAKEIELCFVTGAESRVMACDPDMIERILLNLISNAIKFTDKNGRITVSLKEAEGNIELEVSDTGVGIPQDKLALIFDRFRQAEDTFVRNKEGSGIGLSLVKAFVEAHGGVVSVTSEVSRGTTFHIKLPIRLVDKQPVNPETALQGREKTYSGLPAVLNRVNIEFSDIYSCYDGEIS